MRGIGHRIGMCLALCVSTAAVAPVWAQDNLGNIISGVAQTLIQQEQEKAAFGQAQRTNTISGYRNYLQQYPQGNFRDQAERALENLGGGQVAVPIPAPSPGPQYGGNAAAREADLGLNRSQRIAVQRQLTAVGYSTGGSDGVWGRNTRNALSRWQSDNNEASTGYITGAQLRLLSDQASARPNNTRPTDTRPGDYRPDASQGAGGQAEETRLGLSASERREVQLRLTLLGYDTRGTDGSFGQNTRKALAKWQGDQGERATGYLTSDQLRILQRQTRS